MKSDFVELFSKDLARYNGCVGRYEKFFLYFLRRSQTANHRFLSVISRCFFKFICKLHGMEVPYNLSIKGGPYLGHTYNITINSAAILGENINIHKGVTIGQENRGKRKGVPVIGNNVWIGINSTIVGHIVIGDDVLIAPNSYVNCDIPAHSVVFGNPCIIRHKDNATEGYINNKVPIE